MSTIISYIAENLSLSNSIKKTSMFRKLINILCFLLVQSQISFSQNQSDSVYHDFGLSIGINSYQIKEKVLNNIRHTGIFPSLGFSYEWANEKIKQRVELFLIVNMLKSRYEAEHAPIVIDPSLNYSHIRKVTTFNPDIHLFLGGIAGLYSHMAFFDNWDDSHIYWLTYYYVGFSGLLTYGNPFVSSGYIEISFPILSLVSRPPARFLYKMVDDKFSWIFNEIHNDLRVTSIHQHFVLNLDLGYKFKHSESFQQKVYWRMSYFNTQMPYSKELIILTNTVGTILLF